MGCQIKMCLSVFIGAAPSTLGLETVKRANLRGGEMKHVVEIFHHR